MFTSIDTAIEEMIQSNIDGQDLVCRLDAEGYTDQCVSDCEDSISELIVRIEELEQQIIAPSDMESGENLVQELADSVPQADGEKPRTKFNQMDWVSPDNSDMFAGFPDLDTLLSYIRASTEYKEGDSADIILMMALATIRNIINTKLEAES